MDVSSLLDGMNDEQRTAVAAPAQNMLVLAGAAVVKLGCWCIALLG